MVVVVSLHVIAVAMAVCLLRNWYGMVLLLLLLLCFFFFFFFLFDELRFIVIDGDGVLKLRWLWSFMSIDDFHGGRTVWCLSS
jgi:hypothetical protein